MPQFRIDFAEGSQSSLDAQAHIEVPESEEKLLFDHCCG